MNKVSILVFLVIVALFGSILYVTSSQYKKDASPLPPEADTFQVISPSPQKQADSKNSSAQPTFGVEEGVKATSAAIIKTSKGDIAVTLIGKGAPRTVKNFIEKANSGFYKNLTFHRVEDWVIQGGDPKGNGTGGGVMQTEINDLPFVAGALGVARGQDIRVSNDSQFFITKTDAPHLNEKYTLFGIVTAGMDVVKKITIGDKILGITVQESQ